MDEFIFLSLEQVIEQKSGLMLVDKPIGWSSHDVVGWVRRQVGVKRVGHAGTLDPLATGLLIVMVGREFTKLQDRFLKQDKVYAVTAKFGVETNTFDSQGQVANEAEWVEVEKLDEEKVKAAMSGFLGEIEQQVPIYSAVKVGGQKLYNLARRGEDVESLPVKKVKILSFELENLRMNVEQKLCEADFVVEVGSGTYIRSLIHDLGQVLKTGAHVTALRRLSIGKIELKNAVIPVSKRLS